MIDEAMLVLVLFAPGYKPVIEVHLVHSVGQCEATAAELRALPPPAGVSVEVACVSLVEA